MLAVRPVDTGSGRALPSDLLLLCTCASIFTTLFSSYSVIRQLSHYYKPYLQRYVVRILVMPLLYAIASTISLFSLQLAEMIDLGFVIYCFYNLLVEYLGGEDEILEMLRNKPRTPQLYPLSLCLPPVDMSNPRALLAIKWGVMQYVQLKPVLAFATIVLRLLGKYQDGRLALGNGYTWIASLYNISVFVALYALTLFFTAFHKELAPFHALFKFICVKSVIFFSFWQGLCISILVALGFIQQIGSVVDNVYLSAALQDTLITMEMPIFAVLHAYAFSYKDFEPKKPLVGCLPFSYAIRDSFGIGDLVAGIIATFHGLTEAPESDAVCDTTPLSYDYASVPAYTTAQNNNAGLQFDEPSADEERLYALSRKRITSEAGYPYVR
ncbi:hypothetical protein MVES1_001294 [Malassezia vespertilionis]|uniref:uncharacterized protein n=1 Tax=Malassezia vespertilionis TaxID=2020962 RepID=UPI0024B1ED30|nr:uncharacterized protein MVES1_001294 [Malassezia vespertilionis]WFD05956.1 hypothetical protein MVES1_001294 [Malassezia vespertilionis]